MGERTVAVVLGRAGSKGLPRKIVAPVAGRPCICWTIEAALDARLVDDVLVSTDDDNATQIAHAMGVRCVERRAEDATDGATVVRALWHALVDAGDPATRVVMLYANVPVRPTDLIDRAVNLLGRTGADSVQSYVDVGKYSPAWQARIEPASGRVAAWSGDVLFGGVHRRQDLPPSYVPDGGVIAMTRLVLEHGARDDAGPHDFLGADHRGITTEPGEVVDIDSRVDLLVADAITRERIARAGAA